MSSFVTVVVNGKPHSLTEGSTLLQFCQASGIDPAHIVTELNGNIVKKENYSTCILKENDTLEIVRFVGGG
jgi:sulfur carrier protein